MVVKAKKNSGISGNGDQRLRKIENLLPGGANASTFEYGYDQEGVIQSWSRQLGAGAVLGSNFKYDLADQLTEAAVGTATTPVNHVWRYDPAGNRTSEQVDSLSTAYTSNNLNQVTSLAGGGPVRFEGMINEPGTVKVNGQSAIVAADNSFRVDVALPAGTQMVAVVATDASGNAATKNYQVLVGSAAARTFTYDLNGNTMSDGVRSYAWDAENRLKTVTQAGNTSEFVYDGAGRRVAEKVNGTLVKRWVWCDEAQPCEERDASNTVTKRFYAGLGFQSGGASFFYTQDHLGSTREVVDGSGAVRARYDYSPYGAVTKLSGDVDADFLYTGHYRHAATTLHLTLFRAYDSELGRWLSRDPIEEDGGINLYGYVANNPLAFVDPLGLREVEVYIWKGKGVSSAGHVMITERNQKRAILSQFPALRLLWSHNLPLTYDTTMKKEGRPEDYRFIVDIPDDKKFDDAVVAEWNRDEWNWNPNQKDQTQCSTAAWNAMAAGGMPFKPEKGTFRPSVMGKRLLEMSKQPNSRVRLLPK